MYAPAHFYISELLFFYGKGLHSGKAADPNRRPAQAAVIWELTFKKVGAGDVRLLRLDKSRQSGYFKFWIDHLKFCTTALPGRAAFAAFERFAVGKTSAEAEFISAEHLNH